MARVEDLRIVSGGQTGADRAALDVATQLAIPYGGWCPAGGWAEDLPEPPGLLVRYPLLRETPKGDVETRTRWNVSDADATLILVLPGGTPSAGTELTRSCAVELHRPHLLARTDELERVREWLARQRSASTLNVAGPRESEAPGLYLRASALLRQLLSTRDSDLVSPPRLCAEPEPSRSAGRALRTPGNDGVLPEF
jgi:hypothetical protein